MIKKIPYKELYEKIIKAPWRKDLHWFCYIDTTMGDYDDFCPYCPLACGEKGFKNKEETLKFIIKKVPSLIFL